MRRSVIFPLLLVKVVSWLDCVLFVKVVKIYKNILKCKYFSHTCREQNDEHMFQFSQLRKLIQTAKYNIENHYSVVGITHHMKFTFLLFEYYLPRFFNNSMTIYEDLEIEHSQKIFDNKNPYR